ncbi:MAG: ATP-binding cassette domain-containing protein [Flavobacteriaceae bacterium]
MDRSVVRTSAALVAIGLLSLLFVETTTILGSYGRYLVAVIAFNTVAVYSLSAIAGSSGIWSIGQTSFMAVGGYLTAHLAAGGLPLEAILPVVFVATGAAGYVIGLSAGRFSVLYFGLLTLALAMTTVELVDRLGPLTGGDQGMLVPPVSSLVAGGTLSVDGSVPAAIVIATVALLIGNFFFNGPTGRKWRAIKGQRIAAMALGLVPHRENANAFALSAGLAGISGVVAAIVVGFLEPGMFNLDVAVRLIVGTVLGGVASLGGAVFGASFMVGVPEAARDFWSLSQFAMGLAIVVTMLFLPKGLFPSVVTLLRSFRAGREERSPATSKQTLDPEKIATLVRELMGTATGDLKVERLSVSFGGVAALRDISLTLPAGKVLGLIGPNGAGKTTFLNVLSGYVRPTTVDKMEIGGRDLIGCKPYHRLRLGYGRSFQHAELFDELTVRETLLVACASANRSGDARLRVDAESNTADRLIDVLNLHVYADCYPSELPFGIQKVVDVGRLLALRPSLIALDEPFAGLDEGEVRELRAILGGIKSAGASLIIIDHAVKEVLDIADQVVVLNFGEVLMAGSPREVRESPEVHKAYFGSSAKKIAEPMANE